MLSNFNKLYEIAVQRGRTREQLIQEAMLKANGNISEAARELGITRQALWEFLRRRNDEPLAVGK